MSLIETLRKDMFSATKEGNLDKSNILKIAIASVKNAEIEVGKELEDVEIVKILRKEVKKIEDSIEQYEKMDRKDLLNREKAQLSVLNEYLPQLMSEEDIKKVVKEKIEELKVDSQRDFGRVIGVVMKELSGKADGSVVKDIVQSLLK